MITFNFRLMPTKKQERLLNSYLQNCRFLYNLLLEEREKVYQESNKENKKFLTAYDQILKLPNIKRTYPALKEVYSHTLQNVAFRVEFAFKLFYKRLKLNITAGLPRFKSENRYHSFTFPDNVIVQDDLVKLPKIEKIYFKKHREILGNIKIVTVTKKHNKWFISFVTDYDRKITISRNDKTIGVDVGIQNFATFSDGTTVANPRFFETEQKELKKKQSKYSKNKTRKSFKTVQCIYERIQNKRHNFQHKTALDFIRKYDRIFIEDLDIAKLIKTRCNPRNILDVSWGTFLKILTDKAAYAGREIIKVNPAYTSQICSKCGIITIHKDLRNRDFNCAYCGFKTQRDVNAACNILALGLQSLGRLSKSTKT